MNNIFYFSEHDCIVKVFMSVHCKGVYMSVYQCTMVYCIVQY